MKLKDGPGDPTLTICDQSVSVLVNAVVRRAAQDLWQVAGPPRRAPRKHMIWAPGPGGCYRRLETEEEYQIRMMHEERRRRQKCRELTRWAHTPYARMLFGLTDECTVEEPDIDHVISQIKQKRLAGVKLFDMDKSQRRYSQRVRRRLAE